MRMRYHWFTGRPRHVSRRDYNRYSLRVFGAVATGSTALMMAIAAVSGLTLQTSRQLAGVEAMTIAEAMAYSGDATVPHKLEGFLVADIPLTMPDEPALKVIRGEVILVLEGELNPDEIERETLYSWQEEASPVYLTDGQNQLPLAFDLAVLPLQSDTQADADFNYGGEGRNSYPVEVDYGGQIFPINPEKWGAADSLSTEVTRRFLPQGQTAVIVAGLETTPEGPQLVDPLGNRLRVELGSEAEIQHTGQRLRLLFGVLCFPLGIGSFLLAKSARNLYLDFLFKSHNA
jgi:hypothetical protein